MSELFTIIIILLLVLFFYEMFRCARDARYSSVRSAGPPRFSGAGGNPNDSSDDNPTVRLIGRERYRRMTERVDAILRVHSEDRFIAVRLSCGPESDEGKRALHRLLPGDELKMVNSPVNGVNRVVFYSGGICVGAVMLVEAELLMEIVNAHRSTGIYVAEQNCYDLDGVLDLGIILFYNPMVSADKRTSRDLVGGSIPGNLRAADGSAGLCEN